MTNLGQDVMAMVSLASLLAAIALAVWSGARLHRELRIRQVAEQRAKALLEEFLTESERVRLAQSECLAVQSPEVPSRSYHIPRWGGVVHVYEDGRLVLRLCLQPADWLPSSDVVLIHKLMIEGDEEGYLQRANIMRVAAGPAEPRRSTAPTGVRRSGEAPSNVGRRLGCPLTLCNSSSGHCSGMEPRLADAGQGPNTTGHPTENKDGIFGADSSY